MVTIDTPQSSVIAAIAYFAADKVLEIKFRSGSVYTYFAVPAELWDELCQSPEQSMGKLFHARIKGKYSFAPSAYSRAAQYADTAKAPDVLRSQSAQTKRSAADIFDPMKYVLGSVQNRPPAGRLHSQSATLTLGSDNPLPDNVIPFPPRGRIRPTREDRGADIESWLAHVRNLRQQQKERLENERRKDNRGVAYRYGLRPGDPDNKRR